MEIASKAQLRLAFLRWAIVTVPFVLLLGFASGRLVPSGDENLWYQMLQKPAETPPGWVFPVAWTALYAMMGLALAMIINARGSRLRGLALTLFAVQLAANLVWSPLFFGAHQVFWALVLIVVIFVLALATTLVFGRIRKGAAWLMVPYLAWLCFAGILNYQIDRMNPNAETLVEGQSAPQMKI
ncbi:tryptophan-rich sensory protein [Sphingomonas sp. MG17]|jgi:tryptophan-rich sensory protein|uniref:Tryptophan-rich sensory protein n=1 Tax=Sphingomonas tagetis TaxID=2949092 RepID=A0A9X2KN26_9SPHN|nr:TspO/MBR family protein [Sphingomonas tagetis]MCP3732415.1 tryptophan-rich sensory protein [Sphingomonas tagetis]